MSTQNTLVSPESHEPVLPMAMALNYPTQLPLFRLKRRGTEALAEPVLKPVESAESFQSGH